MINAIINAIRVLKSSIVQGLLASGLLVLFLLRARQDIREEGGEEVLSQLRTLDEERARQIRSRARDTLSDRRLDGASDGVRPGAGGDTRGFRD